MHSLALMHTTRLMQKFLQSSANNLTFAGNLV